MCARERVSERERVRGCVCGWVRVWAGGDVPVADACPHLGCAFGVCDVCGGGGVTVMEWDAWRHLIAGPLSDWY